MKLLKTKTARFAQVIEECGKPQVYTLWQKPSSDRHLQAELKKNRVMTILKTERGSDLGVAGFKENRGATYLVFPKSLKQFVDKRVAGIDWTLVREWLLFYPGGQASARLPRRCTCKCETLSPASGPQLMTTR